MKKAIRNSKHYYEQSKRKPEIKHEWKGTCNKKNMEPHKKFNAIDRGHGSQPMEK